MIIKRVIIRLFFLFFESPYREELMNAGLCFLFSLFIPALSFLLIPVFFVIQLLTAWRNVFCSRSVNLRTVLTKIFSASLMRRIRESVMNDKLYSSSLLYERALLWLCPLGIFRHEKRNLYVILNTWQFCELLTIIKYWTSLKTIYIFLSISFLEGL